MKTNLFVLGLMLAFLTSCAHTPAADVKPASDLAVLQLGVEALTQERSVAGTVQHAEQAATNGELLNYTLALEDVRFLEKQDRSNLRVFVAKSLEVIRQSRLTACRWWQVRCKGARAGALQAAGAAPGGSAGGPQAGPGGQGL